MVDKRKKQTPSAFCVVDSMSAPSRYDVSTIAAPSDLFAAGSAYAQAEIAVFPLLVGQKVPATAHGFRDATTDLTQIKAWWSNTPFNIGLALPADIVVVDLDDPDALARLSERGIDLPQSLTARTPRGQHLWYRVPAGTAVRQTAGELARGVDTRVGGRGYIVAPPSIVDGRRYRWIRSRPEWRRIARAPQALLDRVRHQPAPVRSACVPDCVVRSVRDGRFAAYAHAAVERAIDRIAHAPRSQRNETLNAQAYGIARLVGAGLLDEEHARQVIANAAAQAGLRSREIEGTIRSAFRAGVPRPVDVVLLDARRGVRRQQRRRRRGSS